MRKRWLVGYWVQIVLPLSLIYKNQRKNPLHRCHCSEKSNLFLTIVTFRQYSPRSLHAGGLVHKRKRRGLTKNSCGMHKHNKVENIVIAQFFHTE